MSEWVHPYLESNSAGDLPRGAATPGAVLLVGQAGKVIYKRAFGCRSISPDITMMQEDMVFDVASLTKALVTAVLVMKMVECGRLTLDRRLSHIFQTFGTLGKERITVRHLLTHSSGYPAHMPFYKSIVQADKGDRAGIMHSRGAVDMVCQEIFRARTENLPGKVVRYSDVGFILLGVALETLAGGVPLDKLAASEIFEPLKLWHTGFVNLALLRRGVFSAQSKEIVPTAHCPWRGKILLGEVHDDNAWVMGGIAGHAGLFSTAHDIHLLASELIRSWKSDGGFVQRDVIREFWTKDREVEGSTWALGWDTPDHEHSSSGRYFSSNAVGHLGYTGCSLWIDPSREVDVILLTNRVHPSTSNEKIKQMRPVIHDCVMEALGYS